MKLKKIDLIRLVTPTTNENRLKKILKNASGFLYYVTITGITGQGSAKMTDIKKSIKKIKKHTKLPVVAGFGIKNSSQVKKVFAFADGAVVGSSIVSIIEKNLKNNQKIILNKILKFVSQLKGKNI